MTYLQIFVSAQEVHFQIFRGSKIVKISSFACRRFPYPDDHKLLISCFISQIDPTR